MNQCSIQEFIFKKMEARVRSCVSTLQVGGLGASCNDVARLNKKNFKKECKPSVAQGILELLGSRGYIQSSDGGKTWTCTERGQRNLHDIKEHNKDLLKETSSPEVPTLLLVSGIPSRERSQVRA